MLHPTQLLAVNGVTLENVTHADAVKALQGTGKEVKFLVSHMESVVRITLIKGPTGLGFSVCGGVDHPIEVSFPSVYNSLGIVHLV
jgi:hypothetical protein